MFDRIYFDSSTLRHEGWPRVSGLLEAVFRTAHEIGVELCLPDAVEVELETLWLRELHDLRNDDKTAAHTAGIIEAHEFPPVDWDRMRERYRASASDAKSRWALQSAPMTTTQLGQAFHLTIAPGWPFQNTRPGLRDATIYHSIVDHLRSEPAGRAVLLAQDSDFSAILDDREGERLRSMGIQLRVITRTKADDALDRLWKELQQMKQDRESSQERDRRRAREELARRALERRRADLEQFIKTRGQYSIGAFLWIDIVRILEVDVGPIGTVTVSGPPVPTATEPAKVLAEVNVKVRALARPMELPQFLRPLRESEPQGLIAAGVFWAGGNLRLPSPPDEQVFDRVAVVEATARQVGDEYEIEFVSATIRG